MRRYGLRGKVYPALSVLAYIGGAFGALVSITPKFDSVRLHQRWPDVAESVIWWSDRSWWIVPVVAGSVALLTITRKFIGPPWVWNSIHDTVDAYRAFVFRQERGEPLDHHRVTLFRYFPCWRWPCCCKWPWQPRLIPVERSGHLSQKTSTDFPVPDRADDVRGIAGMAWRVFETLIVTDLPDLSACPTEDVIEDYAKRTWTEPNWIRQRMEARASLARSFVAIPIRVKGREWGVVVIDSQSPDAIIRSEKALYDLLGRSLSKLLERV